MALAIMNVMIGVMILAEAHAHIHVEGLARRIVQLGVDRLAKVVVLAAVILVVQADSTSLA